MVSYSVRKEVADIVKLTVEETQLARAETLLSDAAATGDTGRSYPDIEMLTPAADTVRSYTQAVRLACEVISDGAQYAATSAAHITLGFDEADRALATAPR